MAISFPSDPYPGQSVVVGSKNWVWNGNYWAKSASLGGGTELAVFPELIGNTGRFLTTDGTTTNWGNVIIPPALPTQTGNSGRFLTTDGTTTSWGNVIIPAVSAAAISDQTNTSTGYLGIPTGNTTQRPGSPANGASRINSETNYFETYYNSNWINLTYIGLVTATSANATVTYSGNYAIHTFLTSGTFTPTSVPVGGTVECLVIAGGGGGGNTMGGGGGAGGLIYSLTQAVAPNVAYTVTVGAGGVGASTRNVTGTQGVNSSIIGSGTPSIAIGGGGGSSWNAGSGNGGSGGGGGGGLNAAGGAGTVGQGNAGGNASGTSYSGSGGGGAGAAATATSSGPGGVGLSFSISGSTNTYSGGGGGAWGSGYGPSAGGAGGAGGGGAGGQGYVAGTGGTANTGGGGGGGGYGAGDAPGGAGGSGIVIIRYRYQ